MPATVRPGKPENYSIAFCQTLVSPGFREAASFALSAWTLSKVRAAMADPAAAATGLFRSIGDGLRHFWSDTHLRALCLYFAAVSALIAGPVQVGLPVLVDQRLGGVGLLGAVLATHGAGTLLGLAMSAARPSWRLGTLGLTILAVDTTCGLLFTVGAMAGFLQVRVWTWMQRRVPPAMLGRAMSLFMFIFMGVGLLSAAVTGALLRQLTVTQMMLIAGVSLITLALAGMVLTPIRHLREAVTG